jgi:heme/copper-type cytochrome/quinol oxidase subunit 2
MDEKNKRQTLHKNSTKKYKRNRQIGFAAITIVVLGLASILLFNAFYTPPLPAAGNVIDISADMGGFDKDEIRIKVNQEVTIRLRSLDKPYHTDGGGKHQWAVDDFNASVIAPSEGTATVTFTPTKPGTYTFYCDICCGGRANPSMNGKLIVEG